MKKLIKINTDHYIIVDDSEIKEGDWVINGNNKIFQYNNESISGINYCKKITHSTQPLDCNCSNRGYKLDSNCAERNHCFDKIQYLSLQEVKELIGEVDVEKKAEYDWMLHTEGSIVVTDKNDWKSGFHHGYNQALEDNKEKKYTEEDLRKAIQLAWEADSIDGTVDLNIVLHYGDNNDLRTKWSEDEIIKSLQSKTSWDVQIVDGKLKLKL